MESVLSTQGLVPLPAELSDIGYLGYTNSGSPERLHFGQRYALHAGQSTLLRVSTTSFMRVLMRLPSDVRRSVSPTLRVLDLTDGTKNMTVPAVADAVTGDLTHDHLLQAQHSYSIEWSLQLSDETSGAPHLDQSMPVYVELFVRDFAAIRSQLSANPKVGVCWCWWSIALTLAVAVRPHLPDVFAAPDQTRSRQLALPLGQRRVFGGRHTGAGR